jgi:hypothetical protein
MCVTAPLLLQYVSIWTTLNLGVWLHNKTYTHTWACEGFSSSRLVGLDDYGKMIGFAKIIYTRC